MSESASFPLPKESKAVATFRWIYVGIATMSGGATVLAALRFILGWDTWGSTSGVSLPLFGGCTVVLVGLVAMLAPVPQAVRIDGLGLTWVKQNGREWRVDWNSVPDRLELGVTDAPFGTRSSPMRTVTYWLVYRTVRTMAITKDVFDAIRASARFRGLREIERPLPVASPTTSRVSIRFALAPSPG